MVSLLRNISQTIQHVIARIENNKKSVHFSGSGAHHQNNVAERSIGTIFSISCTILIHAAIRLPAVIEPLLLPMALEYCASLYNRMPNSSTPSLSPLDLLPLIQLNGCLVHVLDPTLQNNFEHSNFTPRSCLGMFAGIIHHRSSTVPIVLKLDTLSITP
jgi:hypothetical protein